MKSARVEAFTDGVVAIIITITVLEMKVPEQASLDALRAQVPVLAAYVLSFVNVGLYWNNHHHLFHATEKVDGSVLWANLFMLFWLSLAPWVIRWLDEAGFAPMPTAAYGVVFGMAAIGYSWTEARVMRIPGNEKVGEAIGRDWKGKASLAAYPIAIGLAFISRWAALAIYIAIAAVWLIPDPRIESKLND